MSAKTILDEAFTALIGLSLTVVAACRLTGRPRATHYRHANPPSARAVPVPRAERAKPPSTLTEDERAKVLAVINSEQYSDLSECVNLTWPHWDGLSWLHW